MKAIDLKQTTWRKSTYSSGNGQCVEASFDHGDILPVRDSKDPSGPKLMFPSTSWSRFLSAIKTANL